VLGKIVAKTKKSLSAPKANKIELAPKKKGTEGRSRERAVGRETTTHANSEKTLLMPSLKKHFKATASVRRPHSQKMQQKSRAERLTERQARSKSK
jgi:hypothetical protein